jgi:hypothetical protein
MPTLRIRLTRWLPLLAAAAPALAAPPAASFLTPSQYAAARGATLTLRFDAGAAKTAQPVAWPTGEVGWFFIRGGKTQENQHDVRPRTSRDNFIPLDIRHAGVTLVGADLRPAEFATTGAELRAFIEQNVAASPAVEKAQDLPADQPLRVRQFASVKTLVRAQEPGGKLTPSAIATSKSGQAVEIRPNFDPTAATVDSDLPLSVYVGGDKLPGAKVQATNVGTGKTVAYLANNGGAGYFHITDPGVWRVEFHHAVPVQNDPAADWVIYSATLTFEVSAKGGAR